MVETLTFPTPDQLPQAANIQAQIELTRFFQAIEWHESIRLSPLRLIEVIERSAAAQLRKRTLNADGMVSVSLTEVSDLLGFSLDLQNKVPHEPIGLTEAEVFSFLVDNLEHIVDILKQRGLEMVHLTTEEIEVHSPAIGDLKRELEDEALAVVREKLLEQPRNHDVTFRLTNERSDFQAFQIAAIKAAALSTKKWRAVRVDQIVAHSSYGLSLIELTFYGR